ncbi:MAG TPA: Ig-like domain-containing protein [Rubrobacter sp.]|nr:Ig-like domain-containing protein [Rubrobacter sp.]
MTDAGYTAAQVYVRGTVRRWGMGRTLLVGVIGALVMVAVGVIFAAYAAGQGAAPVEGESFTKPPGTQVVLGDQYSGGKALKITSGQALPTKRVTITETSNVLVRARAGQTGGSPTLTIRVDGTNAGTRRITSKVLSDYLYSGITLQPGTYTIGLKGGNLAQGRNVFVEVLSFPAVTPPSDPPVAVEDSETVGEDSGATTIDVLANDTDADGGTKTIESVTQPANGTVEITNNGNDLSYKPNADYCNDSPGTDPETFTYTISPGGSTATVSVKVTCVDDPPVAVNDSATVEEDAAATNVSVLTNDTDIDGGPKTISSASDPAKGTVVVTGGGSGLTYQPDPNYCNDPPATNLDTFTYTLNGDSQGTVSMTVTCVNDNPVATDESFNGASRAIGNTSLVVNDPTDGAPDPNGPQKTVSGDILSNDTDVDGPGPLAVQAVSNKATTDGGSVTIEADGDFTFHPKAGTSCTDHTDSFDYTLMDGNTPTAGTDTGTVTIDIQDCVWYVDSSLGTNGDGRSHSPFNSLSGINGAGGTGDPDDANQKIFLYDGTYSGGLPLENGQTLFSQRHGLVVPDGGSGNVTLEAAVPAGPNTTITGGLTLASGNTIQGIHLGNATGAALFGTSVGNATMNTATSGAIDNTTGKAVDISNGTLNMVFTSVSSSGSSTDGIRLDNTAGTFNAAGGSIQNATDQDVDISGNNSSDTVDFTYDGSITDDLGTLVNVSGQNGGTKDFNGAISDGNDGDGGGISLNSNTGATVRFDGGLTLSTGTNPAFTATGGGAVNVTGTANTIATTTGTALNVANTIIGSNGLTFGSISANGASSGIVLNNTGSTGRLVVGPSVGGACNSIATCAGGTIQNSTGPAISLTNTRNVSLTEMYILNGATHGISGTTMTDASGGANPTFELKNSFLESPGDGDNESAIFFDTLSAANITGRMAVSDTTIQNFEDVGLHVGNNSGTLTIDVTNVTFNNNSDTNGEEGIDVAAEGTANTTLDVGGSTTFTDLEGGAMNVISQQSGDVDMNINGTTTTGTGGPDNFPTPPAMTFSSEGSSSGMTFDITNNDILDSSGDGIFIGHEGVITGRMTGNDVSNIALGDGLRIDTDTAAPNTATILVDGNNFGNVAGNTGIGDDGIQVLHRDGTKTLNLTVTNNQIKNTDSEGIRYFTDDDVSGGGPGNNVRIANNQFGNNGVEDLSDSMVMISQDPGTDLCTHITGNTSVEGITLQQSLSAVLQITQASTAALAAVNGNATVTPSGTITFNGTCTTTPQPTNP